MTIIDLNYITHTNELITYFKAFVKFYNWKNYGQVYEIYGIIKLKKICILIIKNSCNLDAY